MRRKAIIAFASAAMGFHVYMGFSFIKDSSLTYDEAVHLSTGYTDLETGKYNLNIGDHPPLSEMFSALPLRFLNLNSFVNHPYYFSGALYHFGDLFLHENAESAEKILNVSRIFTFLAWTMLFPLFLFLSGKHFFGESAGFLAVAAFALFPAFVSNNSLVTTDSASAFFYFTSFYFPSLALYGIGKKPVKFACFAAAGIFSGLAMCSKYSMFIVPGVALAVLVAEAVAFKKIKVRNLVLFSGIYLAAVFLTLSLFFKWDLSLYLDGLSATIGRLSEGRSSFAWGYYSTEGVWWYFPFAFLLKTPLFIILGFAAGLALAAKKFEKKHLWLLVPFLVYSAGALTSKVQIGVRHILPLMPYVCLLAGFAAVFALRKRTLAAAAAIPFCLSLFFIFRTHPHYLAFFNCLAGGPRNGWKYLADSNLDWGQGVKDLAFYLEKNGNPPVIFSYFGVSRPEYYGINYFPFACVTHVKLKKTADVCSMDRTLLAVSATNLQGVYYRDKEFFGWIKKEKPVYTAGYSIFLYDLTDNDAALKELAERFRQGGYAKESACLEKLYN